MPTTNPIKNAEYVKKSKDLKKREIGINDFNRIHAEEQSKHRNKLRQELGEEEYKRIQAEKMRAYRQSKKQSKTVIQPNTSAINILQNAFKNKLARNALIKAKQDKANELVSQINKQKQLANMSELRNKLNASVIANDMLNNIFPSVINTNYPIKSRGRPRLSNEEKLRREQQKLQKQIRGRGRPRKNN